MHELAHRIEGLQRSGIAVQKERSPEAVSSSGTPADVIDLADGDPDFSSPAPLVEACVRALEQGQTHYIETGGLIPLREAILDKMGWSNRGGFERVDDIIITPGSKFALYAVLACLIDPGDSVIVLDPYWVSFDHMVKLVEGTPVHIPSNEQGRFFPDLEELAGRITPKTKAIIVNSPNNPTARIYDHAEMSQLLDLADKHNLYVISDEIYGDLAFDVPHVSAATFRDYGERLVIVNSFSKSFAMTGWRLGYILGDVSLMEKVAQLQQHTVTCANSFAQYALLDVLQSGAMEQVVTEIVQELGRRREGIQTELDGASDMRLMDMEGAFYAWIKIPEAASDSRSFTTQLYEHHGVSVVPGSVFGPSGEGYLRLCYARAGEQILRRAMGRLKVFAAEFAAE